MNTSLPSKLIRVHLQVVMQGLYDSSIECAIYDEWDAGWEVRLPRLMRPLASTLSEAAAWLHVNAVRRYPNSAYARMATTIATTSAVHGPDLSVVLQTLYNCEERVFVHAVLGTGWRVGCWPDEAMLPTLSAAAQWLAERGRVRMLRSA